VEHLRTKSHTSWGQEEVKNHKINIEQLSTKSHTR
jgi:hypothetical protein